MPIHARHLLLALLLLGPAAAPAQPAPPSRPPAASAAPAPDVPGRIAAILDRLEASNDAGPALIDLTLLLDSLIAHTPAPVARDLAPWREVAAARRTVANLSRLSPDARRDLLPFLRQSPALAANLAFLLPTGADPVPAYTLLARLKRERGEHLERYATLAAAVCAVHGRPLAHHINENTATAADPVAVFDFFRTTERNLSFGLRDVPAELLVYVVDTTASVEEMAWAQARYKGDRQVGRRYFDIRYDRKHYRTGEEKKVTAAGFNLRNILAVGGICADQAYFAAHAGKAIGVPTAYVVGESDEMGHAWVGFLESKGRALAWNFDFGRYNDYQVNRGLVIDPLSRAWIPDSYLGILAGAMTAPAADRHGALALVDAAARIKQLRAARGATFPPVEPDPAVAASTTPRAAVAAAQLELIEAALRTVPATTAGWFALRDLAAGGDLSLPELRRWSTVLFQLCGQSYPEFSLEILRPMISSVQATRDQDALWASALRTYSARADLAAEIRLAQGAMWEQAGNHAKAWECYHDVVARFAASSTAAVTAARACQRMLVSTGKENAILPFLEDAWKRTRKPKGAALTFTRSSNWNLIGAAYADALEKAGRARDAQRIRTELGLLDP